MKIVIETFIHKSGKQFNNSQHKHYLFLKYLYQCVNSIVLQFKITIKINENEN